LALGPVLQFLALNTAASVSDAVRRVFSPIYVLVNLGLIPILVVAAGLLVLARLDRSRLLAGTGGLVIVLLALAPVHVNTAPFGADFPDYGYLPTVLLPALVLLTTGVVATMRARRPRT
jgi:hypothetical protein